MKISEIIVYLSLFSLIVSLILNRIEHYQNIQLQKYRAEIIKKMETEYFFQIPSNVVVDFLNGKISYDKLIESIKEDVI